MYPYDDKFLRIREVATVMDAAELCATKRNETIYDPLKELPEGYKCEDDPGQAE